MVGDRNPLADAIMNFEPLPHAAGQGAQKWLRARVTERDVPIETHLALERSGAVLGFYAVEPMTMSLAKDDWIKILLRRKGADDPEQPGLLICWIARSRDTESGFGENLVQHAIINARVQGSVALAVRPHDAPTERLWCDRYHFMRFKNDSTGPNDTAAMLWHPVDALAPGSWPS